MSLKIYKITTSGSSSNASLTYNFDNVAKGIPDTTTSLNNIKSIFSEYDENIKHVSFSTTSPNKMGSKSHQLSYYDNVKNSNIDYTINFLHVCPSPVNTIIPTDYKSALSIILECTTNDIDNTLLLIIIPLSPIDYTSDTNKLTSTPETNINNLSLLVNSVDQTDSKLKKQYEKDNNFKYDCVIRCRFDYFFTKKYDLNNFNFNFLNIKSDCNHTPYAINDHLALSNSQIMDIYSDIYNNIDHYYNKGIEFNPEVILGYHIQINNINTIKSLGSDESYVSTKEQRRVNFFK